MSSEIPSSDPNKYQDYPEQLHAGRAGLGPNYETGPGLSDKIGGLYEEAKGKLLKKPELAERGHHRRTGEPPKKEEANGKSDPFGQQQDEGSCMENPDNNTPLKE